MAATTTTSFPVSVSARAEDVTHAVANRRRSISPQAGRALVIVGHAVEYLTDGIVHQGGPFSAHGGELEAVQLLMAVNRQIYFECPEVPPLSKRIFSFLHPQTS